MKTRLKALLCLAISLALLLLPTALADAQPERVVLSVQEEALTFDLVCVADRPGGARGSVAANYLEIVEYRRGEGVLKGQGFLPRPGHGDHHRHRPPHEGRFLGHAEADRLDPA